eukprot:COSAG01_NODE_3441_length_6094_cov_16.295079_7_plen_65_part_00
MRCSDSRSPGARSQRSWVKPRVSSLNALTALHDVQVLPGRTHPEMGTYLANAGYVLSGIKVCTV